MFALTKTLMNGMAGRQKCYLCKKPRGACIQCSKTNCFLAYHVTCAQDNGLYLKLKAHNSHFDGGNETRSFCDKHTPVRPLPRRFDH